MSPTIRAARLAQLEAEYAFAASCAAAALLAWDRQPNDPAHALNYDAFREQCSRLSRQINDFQEVES